MILVEQLLLPGFTAISLLLRLRVFGQLPVGVLVVIVAEADPIEIIN
jgi:hypothetical protein